MLDIFVNKPIRDKGRELRQFKPCSKRAKQIVANAIVEAVKESIFNPKR